MTKAVYIDEHLPSDPTEAQAVLLIRRQLREQILEGDPRDRARALAMLFGRSEAESERFEPAASAGDPIEAAAARIAEHGVAQLGHAPDHVERCRQELLRQKSETPEYSEIVAFDLGTLLALARAKELARMDGIDGQRPVPVLVTGPTGSGKGLLAQAVHQLSARRAEQMHPIVIAGLPENLVTSELFGHKKGAFTGATGDREGHLRAADGGTVFLDEVGDLQMEAQVQLLRFLEDGVFHRMGDDKSCKADVRVVAATWQNLPRLIEEKKFRLDLYHRICTGLVALPPLSARLIDFDKLIQTILESIRPGATITPAARDALRHHPWPGNLRELHGVLTIASHGCRGSVRIEDLPWDIQRAYLQLPIEKRAAGLLGDSPTCPVSVAKNRAAVVARAVSMTTPPPEAPEQTKAMLAALDMFPDPTGTHQSAVSAIREAFHKDYFGMREARIADRLTVAAQTPDLPHEFTEALAAEESRHRAAAVRFAAEATRIRNGLPLASSPWLRLYVEASEHPLFRGDDGTALAQVMGSLAFTLRSVEPHAPEFVTALRDVAATGGVRGLVDRAKQLFLETARVEEDDEDDDATVDELTLPQGSPTTWGKRQWEELVAAARTREELADAVDVSSTTLKKYLDKTGVVPHWSRRRG